MLGQTELAEALGMDQSTLNKIENGKRPPSVFNIIALANRLRISTDYLLRGQLIPQMDQEISLQIAVQRPEAVPPIRRARNRDTDL